MFVSRFSLFALPALLGALAFAALSLAVDTLPGSYPAEVLSVTDGDTFRARVAIWPDQYTEKPVRPRGMDTPETRDRNKCEAIRESYDRGLDRFRQLLGAEVILRNVGYDSFGRILADVYTLEGENISDVMLEEGLAHPYGEEFEWCP